MIEKVFSQPGRLCGLAFAAVLLTTSGLQAQNAASLAVLQMAQDRQEAETIAGAICAKPTISAKDLGAQLAAAGLGSYDADDQQLPARDQQGTIHLRSLVPAAAGPKATGWIYASSLSHDGKMDLVDLRRFAAGPTDSPEPQYEAEFDSACRIIFAKFFQRSGEHCFGPAWSSLDCSDPTATGRSKVW